MGTCWKVSECRTCRDKVDKTTDHQQAMTGQKPVLPVHARHITGVMCFTSRVRHQNNVTMDLYKLKAKKGVFDLLQRYTSRNITTIYIS